MDFLRLLEGLRTPVLSAFMAAVTYLGDETCFMVVAIAVFWCVSKRQGYYIFTVGFAGAAANQWLKLVFRIPRPWALDPQFTIVESARAAATGYSFPSGHTQNIVGTFGALAVSNKQKRLRILCLVLIVLVPFSRLYLGVHTPLDVGVSFVLALALVLALRPCFRDETAFRRWTPRLLLALLAFCFAYLLFVSLCRFPVDIDADNLASGVRNAWTMLGCGLGLIVAYWFDTTHLHFDEKAPLLGQFCKLALGLALLVAIRAGLKPALTELFQGSTAVDAPRFFLMVVFGVRYFLMVVFAGCVWPMTFPFFAKIGAKKNGHAKK